MNRKFVSVLEQRISLERATLICDMNALIQEHNSNPEIWPRDLYETVAGRVHIIDSLMSSLRIECPDSECLRR